MRGCEDILAVVKKLEGGMQCLAELLMYSRSLVRCLRTKGVVDEDEKNESMGR